MLPFVFKTVDEPIQRLHRLYSEDSSIDVEVLTELYISEFSGSHTEERTLNFQRQNRAVLRGAQDAAYNAFTTFLHQISEPESFLPIELLSQYPYQRYTLILSVARSYELHEVFQSTSDTIRMDQGNSIFEYEGYELSLNAKHHILDSSAYLVAPEKFTVFIRRVNDAENIRFYRSKFIDLTNNAPPPFHLNPQEIIETVQQDIASRESEMPISQMLLFPPTTDTETEEVEHLTNCPECNGEVRRISKSYFCLQCDWDDLPPLERYSGVR
jgi:hypothetical protein